MDDNDYPSPQPDLPPSGPKKFETDFQRPKTSLIGIKNNVIEMIPKYKCERTRYSNWLSSLRGYF